MGSPILVGRNPPMPGYSKGNMPAAAAAAAFMSEALGRPSGLANGFKSPAAAAELVMVDMVEDVSLFPARQT